MSSRDAVMFMYPNRFSLKLLHGSVPWRQRNPYPVMRTIRYDHPTDTADYLAHRRAMIEILNNADGYVTIDGDPGGYDDAQPQHFVNVFLNDRVAIAQFGTNPARQQVIPWLWAGWGTNGLSVSPGFGGRIRSPERSPSAGGSASRAAWASSGDQEPLLADSQSASLVRNWT